MGMLGKQNGILPLCASRVSVSRKSLLKHLLANFFARAKQTVASLFATPANALAVA